MSNLKACPFCGRKLERVRSGDGVAYWHHSRIEENCILEGLDVYDNQLEAWEQRDAGEHYDLKIKVEKFIRAVTARHPDYKIDWTINMRKHFRNLEEHIGVKR